MWKDPFKRKDLNKLVLKVEISGTQPGVNGCPCRLMKVGAVIHGILRKISGQMWPFLQHGLRY